MHLLKFFVKFVVKTKKLSVKPFWEFFMPLSVQFTLCLTVLSNIILHRTVKH